MPIYDFNGTTKQEIGKIYDFNGTASSQIGKVYDNNGSANSLVYSGETVLYEANVFNTDVWGSLTWRTTGTSSYSLNAEYVRTDNYNDPNKNVWAHTTFGSSNKINLAGYSTLNMDIYYLAYTPKSGFIIQSSLDIGGDNPHLSSKTVKYSYCESAASKTTFSLDLSDVQGNYCVVIDCGVNGSWYKGGVTCIYKIWLE